VSRRRNLWISVISAVAAAFLVYAVYLLQLAHIRQQETVSVVAPDRYLEAGTTIESGMLRVRHIPRSGWLEGMISDPGEAIGLETLIPLGADEPIFRWKLNRFSLLPQAGQSTFRIPKEYVLSISSGIRAGDRVVVYASGEQVSGRLFEEEIVVASVKSAANTEVEDEEQLHLLSKARGNEESVYISRRNANAPIDHINLNLTEDQWLKIDEICGSGQAKLVIAFAGYSLGGSGAFEAAGRGSGQ